MNRTAPSLAIGWLEQQAEFRMLADRAAKLLDLQADLRRCAPDLALTVLGLDAEELLAGALNAPAAAKLRQLAPSIVHALRDRGWQVKRIRFRPQPASQSVSPPAPRTKDPIPVQALAELEMLAEAATSAALKEALAHLVRSRRRQRAPG